MVIYTAVGGRMSIFAAVWGSLLVNFAKTSLSESFPQLWLFGLGAAVYRGRVGFPNGLSGHLAGPCAAAHRPPDRFRANPRSGERGATIPSPMALRRSEEIIMLIGHQPKEFFARGRGAHGFLRRLQGGQRSLLLRRGERDPRHHRPEGAGKTTVLDLIAARPKSTSGSIRFRGQELSETEGEPDRADPASAQVSRRRRSSKT